MKLIVLIKVQIKWIMFPLYILIWKVGRALLSIKSSCNYLNIPFCWKIKIKNLSKYYRFYLIINLNHFIIAFNFCFHRGRVLIGGKSFPRTNPWAPTDCKAFNSRTNGSFLTPSHSDSHSLCCSHSSGSKRSSREEPVHEGKKKRKKGAQPRLNPQLYPLCMRAFTTSKLREVSEHLWWLTSEVL